VNPGAIRLLANENFPGPAVRLLRERGVDVLWALESMSGADDSEVLARARAEGRWLLTYDRDYGELVFSCGLPSPRAVIYLRQEAYPPQRPADLVLELLARPEQVDGLFLVVTERSARVRHLPADAKTGG
jgi:predicted nuclease of predicted toxin-antitoxin system